VAHQLLRRIGEENLPPPRRFFVSSCPAPGRSSLSPGVALLPTEAFWQQVARFDGLPRRFFDHPDLVALFEPIFQADFRAVAAYQPARPAALSDVPITVLCGREDSIAPDALAAWQAWTTAPLEIRQFPGGHFYLTEQMSQLAAFLAVRCPPPRG
jgi:surfactin synthase thioesterase subunit